MVNNIGEHDYHKIAEAQRAMEARTKFRRLMTTSNQPWLGLVPASTQQGDVIIILTHHSRPLVATLVIPDDGSLEDASQHKFKLKGEAFIPGMMEGELVEELMETPLHRFPFY